MTVKDYVGRYVDPSSEEDFMDILNRYSRNDPHTYDSDIDIDELDWCNNEVKRIHNLHKESKKMKEALHNELSDLIDDLQTVLDDLNIENSDSDSDALNEICKSLSRCIKMLIDYGFSKAEKIVESLDNIADSLNELGFDYYAEQIWDIVAPLRQDSFNESKKRKAIGRISVKEAKKLKESAEFKGLSEYQKGIIYDMADEDYEAGHPFTPEDALDWFESGEEESIPPELAKEAADYYFEAFDDIRENDNSQYDESVKSHNKPIKEHYATMHYSDIPEYPIDAHDDPIVFCGHLNHYLPNKFHINVGGELFTTGTGGFWVYVSNEYEMFRGSVIYKPNDNKIYFTINSEDAELGVIVIDEDTTWDDLGNQVAETVSEA